MDSESAVEPAKSTNTTVELAALGSVQQQEGILPAKVPDEVHPVLAVQVQDHLGIAVGVELVAKFAQLFALPLKLVHLAVADPHQVPVAGKQGLGATPKARNVFAGMRAISWMKMGAR